jgi:CIC family chloride channel protein
VSAPLPSRYLKRPVGRWGRTILLSATVGILAGLAAVALESALHVGTDLLISRFAHPGDAAIWQWRWELVAMPMAGGLLSGIIVQLIARRPPGHGTDQMVHAFHHQDGKFPINGPTIRAGAAVGVISFGGSAGPEGPIAALGAAIGSKVARLVHLTPRDRRTLLIAGCAAAVGALFQCPLGGALFATGILYREPEFEGSALVASFIASVFGYSTYVALLGFGARVLSGTSNLSFQSPIELPVYVVLGFVCGVIAMVFSRSVRFVENEITPRMPLPVWVRPAVGGALTGLIACALPQVMDGRYVFIQGVFDASLFATVERSALGWMLLFMALTVAKCVATALTVGTGAAGGVLGPCVVIGGTAGAAVGAALEVIAPGTMPEEMRQALIAVGMAGVLSGTMRTPLAAMVMVMEMTGSFGLIVPLMIVAMTAYMVGGRYGMVEAQVDSPADSPAHVGDALMHLLERHRAGDVMMSDWPLRATPSTPLPALLDQVRDGVPPHIAVLDGERLVGMISLPEMHHALAGDELPPLVIAADVMAARPFALYPSDTLYEAVNEFQQRKLDVLPVVSERRGEANRLVGVLTRAAVAKVVNEYTRETRETVLHEHEGFAALQEQDQLSQILAGLPTESAGDVVRIPVDDELVGQTLASVDFRRKRHAEVLAIRTAAGAFLCPPDPHRVLAADDSLLVLTRPRPRRGAKAGA